MPSPIVSVRDIDFKKFLNFGTLANASKNTVDRKRCYIITKLNPNLKEVDVVTLIKEKMAGKLNKNERVILCLTDKTTKLQNIKSSGLVTYLKVEDNFRLPFNLKIQGQKLIRLVGSRRGNELYGGDGNDWFSGGEGDDVLEGHEGNNQLYGGAGDDWLSSGNDNDTLSGNAGDDVLLGYGGKDKLYGGADNDELLGDAGDDQLIGGPGNDRLWGGPGDDKLYGGPGNNIHHFHVSNNTGHDVMQLDRSKGIDRIYLGENKRFITKWNSQKQEVEFYLFTSSKGSKTAFTYNGSHITVKGLSQARKLLVKNYGTFKDELLIAYEVTYRIKGQKETRSFDTLLFRGTREIFLPANCELVSLRRPKGLSLDGAVQKTFIDKTGKLNALFAVK